jgi:hypothetical protein
MNKETAEGGALRRRSRNWSGLVNTELVALVRLIAGAIINNLTGGPFRKGDLQCDIHLQTAGAAGGLIDDGGKSGVVDDGATQNGVSLIRIVDDLIARAGAQFARDSLRKMVRELVTGGDVREWRDGDGVDVLGDQVGFAGYVIAAGTERQAKQD